MRVGNRAAQLTPYAMGQQGVCIQARCPLPYYRSYIDLWRFTLKMLRQAWLAARSSTAVFL